MKSIRWRLILIPALLISFGLVELYFIKPALFYSQLTKVFIFVFLAIFLNLTLKKEHILNYGSLLYYTSLVLLFLTLVLGKGRISRWLNIGGLQLQPSEIAKLGLILILSRTLSNTKIPIKGRLLRAGLYTFIPFLFTLLQPDLGTALTFIFIAFTTTWFSGLDPFLTRLILLIPLAMLTSAHALATFAFYLLIFILLFVIKEPVYKKLITISILSMVSLSTPFLWYKVLKPYQRDRLTAFLNPSKSKTKEGWQIYQAKIALGSGGLLGKGPGKGTQKGLAFLPAAHTDFIFSSFGEEFGFLGLATYIILFSLFISAIMRLAEIWEGQPQIIAIGIFSYFAFHFVVNIFSNLSLLPVVGIPLPFMSYGGSHFLVEILGILILKKMED